MTEAQATETLVNIPIGSKLQLIKKNGVIVDVRLASHDVSGTEEKDYGSLVVPALPPALTVNGTTRFGNFRIELEEIINIAVVE